MKMNMMCARREFKNAQQRFDHKLINQTNHAKRYV